MGKKACHIGFIATRLEGSDGVSLESKKWSDVLSELGHECFFFAGSTDRDKDRSQTVPEAHFEHPEVREIDEDLFGSHQRLDSTSEKVHQLRSRLKEGLKKFIKRFDIHLLIVENAVSIPMNIPLGLAITELVAESDMPCIAHHHDFTWERERFGINAARDYLQAAFPPAMPEIHHVVINSYGASELARRAGMSSTLIPNVMDFENPPKDRDDYSKDMDTELGVAEKECFLLQPTRVVPRKQIERAIDLARRLDVPNALVVSHSSGDEGHEYKKYLHDFAEVCDVKLLFAEERFSYHRGRTSDEKKIYSLADAYRRCDLVTYPSRVEGFGNAFLEAIYYKRPIMLSCYEIYKRDLRPKGFRVIEFNDFIPDSVVDRVKDVLCNPGQLRQMTEHNFEIGREMYSFSVLRKRLENLIEQSVGRSF